MTSPTEQSWGKAHLGAPFSTMYQLVPIMGLLGHYELLMLEASLMDRLRYLKKRIEECKHWSDDGNL